MISDSILVLSATAAYIGFIHTLCGPDHYLPFIVMRKARNWSIARTMAITFLCGIGHVLGSVILGLIGVALGLALGKLKAFEEMRGNLAAQVLIIFGFTYCIWGIHRALRKKPHTHVHFHEDTGMHSHPHAHVHGHSHVHQKPADPITPWILFTVFVLGPCEPLIPLIMYPAAEHSMVGVLFVAGIFAVVTIATMMTVVLISSRGMELVKLGPAERFSHALAGATICLSGLTIQFLGL